MPKYNCSVLQPILSHRIGGFFVLKPRFFNIEDQSYVGKDSVSIQNIGLSAKTGSCSVLDAHTFDKRGCCFLR